MKKILSNIWKFLTYYKNDSSKYKIKIVKSWFSGTYASFKYSINNGRSWRYVYYASEPSYTDYSYWHKEIVSYKIKKSTDFSNVIEKWNTYEKVCEYHKQQSDIIIIKKDIQDIHDQNKFKEKIDIWKNINKINKSKIK